MFDNGAYDLFYIVCILASEGHALLCPGPPNESRSGDICLTHGNKTETRRWLILLITITSRGCECVCRMCVHNMFPITQDFLFKKFDSKWISIKITFDKRYASKICKRSFTRQTDRQRGMSNGADRQSNGRNISWIGKQMQLATRTKRHLIGFRCCAAIGANWRQLVELLTGQKRLKSEDCRLPQTEDWRKYWKDCKKPLAVNKVCHWRCVAPTKATKNYAFRASETVTVSERDRERPLCLGLCSALIDFHQILTAFT